MRIAYLAAGAGSMCCGACAHDFMIIQQLRRLFYDVRVIPAYTSAKTDLGPTDARERIFLGGITTYLRTHLPRVARAARGFSGVLDRPAVIKLATLWRMQTNPRHLGPMTLGVLQGTQGPHAAEMNRLVDHLQLQVKPELVYLSNSLFCPLAGEIVPRLGVPVVANFQGEDSFIMDLPEPYRQQSIELLRLHGSKLARLIAPSQAAAEQASLLLQLGPEQISVIPAPIDAELYARPTWPADEPLVVGYLSVVRPAKGLDLLLRAMQQVADAYPRPIELLVGGQVLDGSYQREMRDLAKRLPPQVRTHFLGELSLAEKINLLHRCHLAVFPSRIAESRAMAAMEAMAAGVPIVAPRHGCFPELLAQGGGWLFDVGSAESLAKTMIAALADGESLKSAGVQAAAKVRVDHNPVVMAQQLDRVFADLRAELDSQNAINAR